MSTVTDIAHHVELLRASHRHWLGRDFIDGGIQGIAAVRWLDAAPFALLSHGTEADPVFNYANRTALRLFGMTWETFTTLPSRLSAEAVDRTDRARLLERVAFQGYVEDYTGVRVGADGRRFRIRNATVWNVVDGEGRYLGQAALIREWVDLAS